MQKRKIVADSSSDVLRIETVSFASAPLKIVTAEREFIDDAALNVEEMVTYMAAYKGRSSTSCPNPQDWICAFGDAEEIFCVTITSNLSGSYNAACAAKKLYEAQYPDRHVFVIDSLSTGPEMALLIEKLEKLIAEDLPFADICDQITAYQSKTGLLFMLESMRNLANNGRVSKLVAKLAGVMNIRVLGKASTVGTLQPLEKPRGLKMTLQKMLERLEAEGYCGGALRIAHCLNLPAAEAFRCAVLGKYPGADVCITACRGLCGFYAERGGMLVGFVRG